MPLLDRIHAARERLRDGSIRSEQAVSQSVVLPILDALGWPRSDPRFVVPEYSVGSGRVDFALLTHGRATVFVEVKQPGLAGRADDQLFRYAYHEGIQIAVLTDGKTWHVYGPGLRGTINERKVAMVDLLNDDPAECVSRFERYLDRAAVDGEAAEENVRADYRRLRERRIARETFGKAWANLVAETRLADLLAAEVERACGFQPDPADVAAFLAVLRPGTAALPPPPEPPDPGLSPQRGFALDGKFSPCQTGRDVISGVFRALAKRDPSFYDRFIALPKHGRTRRYLAYSPEVLYPGRPDIILGNVLELAPGIFLGTNYSHRSMRSIVNLAAEAAGVSLGNELIVRFA